MTKVSTHAWHNGAIRPREDGAPSVASINFHLGTSVFDGLMAYWNGDEYYLHRVEEHLVRFRAGAARMDLEIAWSVDEMVRAIHALLEVEERQTQYVRPIAYRRGPELWVTGSLDRPVDVSIFTVQVPRDVDELVTCQISPVERISSRSIPAQTKVSGAYVNSYRARRTAELAGFQDGIMLDREGRIAEASAANVFLVDSDRLLTPPLNLDVFPGVTRNVIVDLAERLGIEMLESDLRPVDLERAAGVFLCSTLMEIRGVSLIGETAIATGENPVYREIVRSFRALTHGKEQSVDDPSEAHATEPRARAYAGTGSIRPPLRRITERR